MAQTQEGVGRTKHKWRHLDIAFEGAVLGFRPDLLWAAHPGLWVGGGPKTTGVAPFRVS